MTFQEQYEEYYIIFNLLYAIFTVIVALVLLNLLIGNSPNVPNSFRLALMSDTYATIKEDLENEWRVELGKILVIYEVNRRVKRVG